jgi:hypothetical protein
MNNTNIELISISRILVRLFTQVFHLTLIVLSFDCTALSQNVQPGVAILKMSPSRKFIEYGVRSIPIWQPNMEPLYPSIVPENVSKLHKSFVKVLSQSKQESHFEILYVSQVSSKNNKKRLFGVFLGIQETNASGKVIRHMYSFDEDEIQFFSNLVTKSLSEK